MPNPARIAATLGAILDGSPGPVRVHALLHSGLKRGQVRAAVAAGELKVLRRGVVMPSCRWDLGSNRDRTLWAAAAAMMGFQGPSPVMPRLPESTGFPNTASAQASTTESRSLTSRGSALPGRTAGSACTASTLRPSAS